MLEGAIITTRDMGRTVGRNAPPQQSSLTSLLFVVLFVVRGRTLRGPLEEDDGNQTQTEYLCDDDCSEIDESVFHVHGAGTLSNPQHEATKKFMTAVRTFGVGKNKCYRGTPIERLGDE